MAAHIATDLLAADHCPLEAGVAARPEGDAVACRDVGVVVADIVAVGVAFAPAGTGRDSDAGLADGHSHAGIGAAVGAAVALGVLRGQQLDLVVGYQGGVLACRDVAALDEDVAVFAGTGGDEVDVAAGLHMAATAGRAALVAVALALAGAYRDGDEPAAAGLPEARALAASAISLPWL